MQGLKRRLAAVGITASLIFAAQVAVTAPAHADAGHEYCSPAGGLGDFHYNENRWLRVFRFTSGTPDIFVPKQTITNINPAETYSNVTFTVTQAKAESVSTTLTFSSQTEFKLFKMAIVERATATYARQTTETTTTTVGTSVSLSLPPQGRAEIDYGIFVLDVTFDMTVYYNNEKDSSGHCRYQGYAAYNYGRLPTINQRFGQGRVWPSIYRGGVVNGVNYLESDIHPSTVVAIFGDYFYPQDTVLVTQNGATYALSAGTDWWYDSYQQINANLAYLPLVPGSATIKVQAANGRVSNARPVTIRP